MTFPLHRRLFDIASHTCEVSRYRRTRIKTYPHHTKVPGTLKVLHVFHSHVDMSFDESEHFYRISTILLHTYSYTFVSNSRWIFSILRYYRINLSTYVNRWCVPIIILPYRIALYSTVPLTYRKQTNNHWQKPIFYRKFWKMYRLHIYTYVCVCV